MHTTLNGDRQLAFNAIDEVILDLDGGPEPWSVHCEVHVPGHIDPDRLREAARAAAMRHPLARARIAPARVWDRRRRWEIPDECGEVALAVTDADSDQARSARLTGRVDLRTGPTFALTLVQRDDGDRLILNLHHAAGDGKSAFRLMTSIARAYTGHPDPLCDVDLSVARSLRAHAATQTTQERLVRLRRFGERAAEHVTRPRGRVAVLRGSEQLGYGCHLIAFDAETSAAIMAARGAATVNDLLIAALLSAIGRFNAARDQPRRRLSVMMPVNLRPAAWADEVVSNVVSFVSVSISVSEQRSLSTALPAVARRTRTIKAEREAGMLIDVLSARSQLLVAFKDRISGLTRSVAGGVFDTAVLSNLGRLATTPDFGAAGSADELWFSPPATKSMGPAIGATTLDGRIHLVLRYSRSQFDAAGASAFATTLSEVLTEAS